MTRLGFVGVGWLGSSLIAAVPKVPGLSVAAVHDAVPDLAREVAARQGVPCARDLRALLAMDLDAVVISSPNALHAEQAAAALDAGKDVLVQKPLATTAGDARALLALARRTGRTLFVDHTYRFLETTRAFLDVAADGPHVGAAFHNLYGPGKAWSRDPALAGGGALIDLGVHLLDLALVLVRPRALRLVACELGRSRGYAVEDDARLVVDMDGVELRLAVSWEAPVERTEIALRRGDAAWENVDGSFYRFRARRRGRVLLDRETTLREDTLRAFAGALRAGSGATIDPRVHDLIDAAYASG